MGLSWPFKGENKMFTKKANELYQQLNLEWEKSSIWLKMEHFNLYKPQTYKAYYDDFSNGILTAREVVGWVLTNEFRQYEMFQFVCDGIGDVELNLTNVAMDLNREIILSLIPLADLKEFTISENTDYITTEPHTYEELENCLDYLFDDSIELAKSLKESKEKYDAMYG